MPSGTSYSDWLSASPVAPERQPVRGLRRPVRATPNNRTCRPSSRSYSDPHQRRSDVPFPAGSGPAAVTPRSVAPGRRIRLFRKLYRPFSEA